MPDLLIGAEDYFGKTALATTFTIVFLAMAE
jgi:hypothetical protein